MGVGKYIKQLAGESVIYGISRTTAKLIVIILIPIYARVFSPEEYGIVALIATLVSMLEMLFVLGLDNSSARWFYDTDDTAHRKCTIASWFWCQIIVACLLSGALLVLAPWVSEMLLGTRKHTLLVRLAALAAPLATFRQVLGGWLRYRRRAWTMAGFSLVNSLETIGLTILFVVLLRWGLLGIFTAGLLAAAVMAAIAICILRGWISPGHFSWGRLKPMLVFGLPLVPAAIGTWITASSDRFILQALRGTAEVGLYSAAAVAASIVALATGAFQMAWGPFAYSILKEPDSRRVYATVLANWLGFDSEPVLGRFQLLDVFA